MRPTPAERRRRARIEALQAEARRSPATYRTRVALLAGLGFAALLALVLLALVPPVVMVVRLIDGTLAPDPYAIVYLTMHGLFAGWVLLALLAPLRPPEGYRLDPDEAPALRDEIERLRRAAGAPPLDGVIVTEELNAAAATLPRAFGLLGERHLLLIGLPLLRLLDRDELRAVLAHEFGHFRHGDGRFSAWIYRLRRGWLRLANAVALTGHGAIGALLRPFLHRYVAYFDAVSFVLAREDEYAADAVAARLADGPALGSALIRLAHAADWMTRSGWTPMEARMRAQPQPPLSITAETARWLAEAPTPEVARVLAAGEREIDLDDTHPTLPQRLAALDVPAALRTGGSPALELLPSASIARIERALDTHWRETLQRDWAARHAEAASERARLEALERAALDTPADRLQYAHLVERLRPEHEALRAYAQVLALAPDDPTALFRAGVLRVEAGDVEGVALLRQAMHLDAGTIRPVFVRLDAWRRDASLPSAMAGALDALREAFAARAESLSVREGADEDDDLIAHDLDPAARAALEAMLGGMPQVARAWLVRKRVDLPGEPPHYLLLVTWRGSVVSEVAGFKRLTATSTLPGSVTVFSDTDSARKALAQQVRAVCGEPVYRR